MRPTRYLLAAAGADFVDVLDNSCANQYQPAAAVISRADVVALPQIAASPRL
jgi:hypothetical protein